MYKVTAALLATFAGLVLLLSFKSHSAGAPRSALGDAGATGTARSTPSGRPSSRARRPEAAVTAAASPSRSGSGGLFPGDPIDTRYGTMQVAAVVRNGRLADVRVLRETDGGRSHQIDAGSLPVLRSEALSAQSARIDVVSGATYTSEGYARSLQSALDKAGL